MLDDSPVNQHLMLYGAEHLISQTVENLVIFVYDDEEKMFISSRQYNFFQGPSTAPAAAAAAPPPASFIWSI